jgi:Na+-translocating ferredoxin:NAD+ oxidoreductase RnfE subunit
MWLCHKIGREEHVVESVSAKHDLIGSGELIDGLKNLIPRVLRHEADERIQADNCLLIEVVENGRRNGIDMMLFASDRMNLRD